MVLKLYQSMSRDQRRHTLVHHHTGLIRYRADGSPLIDSYLSYEIVTMITVWDRYMDPEESDEPHDAWLAFANEAQESWLSYLPQTITGNTFPYTSLPCRL